MISNIHYYLLTMFICYTSIGYEMHANSNLHFKQLTESDLPLLFQWFQQPYISELWKESYDWKTFKEKFTKRIDAKEIFPYLVYIDNKPIAYIKYHYVNNEDRKLFSNVDIPEFSIGIDLFIGEPEYLGKGYGTQFLKEFIEFLKTIDPRCNTIIVDPAVDNYRAIKSYEKVGFKIIGEYITPYGPTGQGPGPILLMKYSFSKNL